MENLDLSALKELIGKIGDALSKVEWEKVLETVKEVFGKIVEFVSGLTSK